MALLFLSAFLKFHAFSQKTFKPQGRGRGITSMELSLHHIPVMNKLVSFPFLSCLPCYSVASQWYQYKCRLVLSANLFSRLHHLLHCLRRLIFVFRGEFGYLYPKCCPGLGIFHSFWGLADHDPVDRYHAREFLYSLVAAMKSVNPENQILRRLGLYVSHSRSPLTFVAARERGFI
jgi:hypothetical protein